MVPRVEQALDVHLGTACLRELGPGDGVARPVDEAMGHDVVHAPRLAQELDQPPLALCDLGLEDVEAVDEGLAPFEHADVVERGVPVGIEGTHPGQAAFEIAEVRPCVAVVRAEARELDVAQVEQASFALAVGPAHQEAGVAPRVARRMEHLDVDAAELVDVAFVEGLDVFPRFVVELVDEYAAEALVDDAGEAVDLDHGVEAR